MAKGKSPKKGKDILIVGSKMKDAVKSLGKMSSSDLLEALSDKVYEILSEAAKRATDNDRTTIRPHDL